MTGATHEVHRSIAASPERLWRAWFDPEHLVQWLPPQGMTGRILAFDPRPGGAFGLELTYPEAGAGKTDAASDRIGGRFVQIEAPRFFAFDASFQSDDPDFQGVMRMEWRFEAEPLGTRVTVTARHVPPGVAAADHEAGISASLAQLAAHVGAPISA